MIFILVLAGCAAPGTAAPTPVVPTLKPINTPTALPATATAVSPTAVPPTTVPPTSTFVPTPTVIPVTSGTVRIDFAAGTTSTDVVGELQPGQMQDFVVGAMSQQPLMVSTNSFHNDVTFSVKGLKDGKILLAASEKLSSWQTMLTVTQDYMIRVIAGATTEKFTLNVNLPARISFAAGAISVKETGKTVGGRVVSYILRADANQTMNIALDALNTSALLSVYGFQDGQPYLRSAVGSQTFNMKLPATEDYVIQVVPNAGQEANYSLNITIK